MKEFLKEKYNLPDSFILNVGTIEERKNLLALIKAFKIISTQSEVHLVVVGKHSTQTKKVFDEIFGYPIEGRVVFIEDVLFEDLPVIYSLAALFVYPSLFEGFGIPVIEALSCGTPVLTSGVSSMPEAGGEAAHYFDPLNERDMAEKILQVLYDENLQNEMREKGFSQVEKFDKKIVTDQLMKIYKDLI